jgi:uncharacterized protein YbdZ (MbtH family)
MLGDEKELTTLYKVVVNHEEQFSIWPAGRESPAGWRDEGMTGSKSDCLSHIKNVWTDMRPLSLRAKLAQAEARQSSRPAVETVEGGHESETSNGPTKDDLVNRLIARNHTVQVSIRPQATPERLKEAIDRGFVFLNFTGTRGGTELGIRLDPAVTDWKHADFQAGKGTAHLVGSLTLNDVRVRCVADIDLEQLTGEGHLELATK